MIGILSLTTFAPLVGVAAILVLRAFAKAERSGADQRAPRVDRAGHHPGHPGALGPAGGAVRPARAGFQFVEDAPWFAGLHYRMGVDGISVLFVLLTAFLMPLCIAGQLEARSPSGCSNI